MKTLMMIALALTAGAALAQQPVQKEGYMKKDGTYVAPHMATAPNATKDDNYSSKPNTNPYTGKQGTVDPYKPAPPPKF